MILSPARRVPTFDDVEQAGDYSGPHSISTEFGEQLVVWFLLPVHRGDKFNHAVPGNGMHAVYEPPHSFHEQSDGSLEIRASIGCGEKPDYYWHGYLDAGNQWRQI